MNTIHSREKKKKIYIRLEFKISHRQVRHENGFGTMNLHRSLVVQVGSFQVIAFYEKCIALYDNCAQNFLFYGAEGERRTSSLKLSASCARLALLAVRCA